MRKPINSARLAAIGASALACLIFSGHYLVAPRVLAEVPALSLAAARGLAGGVVLLVLFHRRIALQASALKSRPHLALALAGAAAFGFCCNQLLLFAGLQRTTPSDAALISTLIPVTAALVAALFQLERWNGLRIGGIILGFSATAGYLLTLGSDSLTEERFIGNLLVLSNVFCFCTAILIIKRFLASANAEAVATCMLLLGGAGLWAFGGALQPIAAYASASPTNLAIVIFELWVTTAAGYTLNFWALKRLSVAATTVFNYLQLPVTAVMTYFILGYAPENELYPAAAMIIVACILVFQGDRRSATMGGS